ncbi:MAG: biopolymer transporter ExbD [Myxococcaceae bacterium]|nr:biopolymer transporter ExbD [Myxococcaceae bacterium]
MAIKVPGKRFGKRLEHSKVFGHGGHGRKATFADLLVTPLVDMFVIIVLFLIANFSATGELIQQSKDVQLPEAAHVQEIQADPVVMVTMNEVFCDGQSIGRVEDFTRDEYLNIPALEEKMRDMKKRFEDLHAMVQGAEEFKGNVNIQAHKEVQFKIIKRVMFSCASAGYGNINFAVLSKGDGSTPAAAPAVQ